MATLIESHVCPNCRAKQEEWATDGPKDASLKRLRKLPSWLKEGQRARATCEDCGETYDGKVVIMHGADETEYFADVKIG